MLLYCKKKHVFGKLKYQINMPRDQFQATSWLVSQVVGSKDRKAANMHDVNSERLTLSPEVLAIRIETTLHSCCNRLVSAMCSTISAKQCNTSCIHFRPERPMTAEFHWNISSKVFGTSIWWACFAACVVCVCVWEVFCLSLSFRSISALAPLSPQHLEKGPIRRLQQLLLVILVLGWAPTSAFFGRGVW